MKIGIACPASFPATQYGGIMFLAFDIAKGAARHGHEPTIYTTDLDFSKRGSTFNKNLPRTEEYEGVRIKRAHVYARIERFFISPGIYRMIRDDCPDIIHIVSVRGFHSVVAALISKRYKIPLVISDQGGLDTHPNASSGFLRILYRLQRPMIRMIIRQASGIIAANEYERDIFAEHCDLSKITIVRNGIDVDSIRKSPFDFKERHDISRFLLFLGRFVRVKGPDILLRAIKHLKTEGMLADHKIVMMGSDFGFKAKMLRMIDELDLGDDVIVIEDPAREEVIAAYHGCEFLVLPSRWEMSPLTPVEGFACKKTSVSSRIRGTSHVIKDGEDGLLFESGNHMDLAEKIACLLKDTGLRDRLAARGQQKVLEGLTREMMGSRINGVYESINES